MLDDFNNTNLLNIVQNVYHEYDDEVTDVDEEMQSGDDEEEEEDDGGDDSGHAIE